MPIKSVIDEAEGGELIVQFALLDGVNWHFQSATVRSPQGRALASYPTQNEAARLLGSALRPALSRLKAVLDRVRQQFPAALTAEASLQRMSLSYLVGHYAVHDELGAVVCQWSNPELQARAFTPVQRASG
jgi:hypothetical protein